MKSLKLIFSLSLFLLMGTFASAQDATSAANTKTETFKVYGNCGMCKRTIEKAAQKESSVTTADWDVKSKVLTVSYDPAKTNTKKIKQQIADAGYDSETHRAKDEVYSNLHFCCQYDRPTKKEKE